MAVPSPYLAPLPGYEGGYQVVRAPPSEAYYAPVQKKGVPWPIKVGVAAGVALGLIYAGSKIIQSQNYGVGIGCAPDQQGIWPWCAPKPQAGGCPPGDVPMPSSANVCPAGYVSDPAAPGCCKPISPGQGGCTPPCSPGYICVNGGCTPQRPGTIIGPTYPLIKSFVCQPVQLIGCCSSAQSCQSTLEIQLQLLDNSPEQRPIPGVEIMVINKDPDHVQTDSVSYLTDKEGKVYPILKNVNTGTVGNCTGGSTMEDWNAYITFYAQTYLPATGGPEFDLIVHLQTYYQLNIGFAGTCGSCSSCTG